MTDHPVLPAPDQSDVGTDPPPPTPRSVRKDMVPWLIGLCFIVLAGAVIYLWQNSTASTGTAPSQTESRLAEQLASLDARLTRLEQQPKPTGQVDLAQFTNRFNALEARSLDQSKMTSRMDDLSGRIESLSGRNQTGLDDVRQQLGKVTARLDMLENSGGNLQSLAGKVDRIARIQAAAFALADGQPLGDLAGAPPAVSRYAHTAPPTLAQLRLAFPQIEHAAAADRLSNGANGRFIDRVWQRAQGLLTVRQGDEVVIGSPSAVAFARIKAALEVGDLVAAVSETAALQSSIQPMVADWLREAKGLVEARDALRDMAAHI